MTIEEAADALVWWLARQPGVVFLAAVQGDTLGPCRYRLGVQQARPEPKRRFFELAPLECEDCYEIKEVSA